MKCALCGLEFEKQISESMCASACPLWKGCELVRCPNCFYENVEEPQWYREVAGHPKPQMPVSTLADWPLQKSGVVVKMRSENRDILQKIIAMGIFYGSRIRLIANNPSFAFKIQNRVFSIDRELAEHIYVEPDSEIKSEVLR